jgi:hypothetical protein
MAPGGGAAVTAVVVVLAGVVVVEGLAAVVRELVAVIGVDGTDGRDVAGEAAGGAGLEQDTARSGTTASSIVRRFRRPGAGRSLTTPDPTRASGERGHRGCRADPSGAWT